MKAISGREFARLLEKHGWECKRIFKNWTTASFNDNR
jgi:hypothetical protein